MRLSDFIKLMEASKYALRSLFLLDEIVGYKSWDEVLRLTEIYTGAGFNVFGDN